MTIYPTAREDLSVHAMLIERFGGSHGVWDAGALESALGNIQFITFMSHTRSGLRVVV